MSVRAYRVPIRDVERCGRDILTVTIERPDEYAFRAGQWFRLTVPTESGPATRTFSHASTPTDGWIEATTRLSESDFKQALASMAAGDIVEVSASGGRLSLPADEPSIALLAGGVGITPIRSLLRDAAQRGVVFDDALLVYGNRDLSCEPYVDELAAMDETGVRLVRVLEHPDELWVGDRGFISADLLRRHLGGDIDRPFILAGPPLMIEAMSVVLAELGVPEGRTAVEAFGHVAPRAR